MRAGGDGETKDEMVDDITHSMDMSLSKLQEIAENRGAWRAAVHGVTLLILTGCEDNVNLSHNPPNNSLKTLIIPSADKDMAVSLESYDFIFKN